MALEEEEGSEESTLKIYLIWDLEDLVAVLVEEQGQEEEEQEDDQEEVKELTPLHSVGELEEQEEMDSGSKCEYFIYTYNIFSFILFIIGSKDHYSALRTLWNFPQTVVAGQVLVQ